MQIQMIPLWFPKMFSYPWKFQPERLSLFYWNSCKTTEPTSKTLFQGRTWSWFFWTILWDSEQLRSEECPSRFYFGSIELKWNLTWAIQGTLLGAHKFDFVLIEAIGRTAHAVSRHPAIQLFQKTDLNDSGINQAYKSTKSGKVALHTPTEFYWPFGKIWSRSFTWQPFWWW